MNPEEEDERAMSSSQDAKGQDTGAPSRAGAAASGSPAPDDAARPGVTDVQAYIGRQLRAVYDDVVRQPIPDRFLALMQQLEKGTPEN